ncbi:phosphotransferase family protein [Kitasatospora sp. NPDC057015]|uniref:phosphotransferase family protein n=1 Tax=Kitasatospora sp. NPDC057015 TaxID=3346001 RepID=UPI00362F8DB1
MHSATKQRLGPAEIRAVVAASCAPGTRVTDVEELTGGTFNAAYRITLDPPERVAVLKISPPPVVPLLTYEHGLMRTETEFYRLAAEQAGVSVPQVLAADFERRIVDGDYLLMSHLPGESWDRARPRIEAADQARLRRDFGELTGRLRAVRGTGFGYPQHGTLPTWRAAYGRMLDDVLADARRYGVVLPVDPEQLLGTVRARAWLLDAVTVPSLVHFDLWEGNVLLAERAGRLEISGVIDGERAFWGDPLADLVSPALLGDITADADFLAGYRSVVGPSFEITPEAARRIDLYRIYLDLIMLVEATPRGYDPAEHEPFAALVRADLRAALDRLRGTPAEPPAAN